MNCFWRKLAAVIHEDCLLCKCFHILTFVELNTRLFWFSINETKETAQSAVNKWDDFPLQEDVWLQWEGQHALCSWIRWILSNLFLIFFEPKTTTKKAETSTPVYWMKLQCKLGCCFRIPKHSFICVVSHFLNWLKTRQKTTRLIYMLISASGFWYQA